MATIISIQAKQMVLLRLAMAHLVVAVCHLPVAVEEPLVVVAEGHVNFTINLKEGELWISFYGLSLSAYSS